VLYPGKGYKNTVHKHGTRRYNFINMPPVFILLNPHNTK